ncbi:MAG: hypothetical protein HY921_04630 [Elusimicrobia bacterium]|nr:hypothetical protein [Elusimicrobiota bacterium]
MSRESVEKLVDRWMNDEKFRAELRSDPQGTVKKAGASLSPEELQALSRIDWSLPDEQLKTRANFGM